MFRPTDPQLSLMESRFLVSPKKRKRLERSWAEAFRTRVLPLIDEEAFRECFSADNGRPNQSIRLLVGLHLLKEADDLTDEQILDALEFNIQWQHALGVEPADAHVCEKTLHNFRHKLIENERAKAVFQQVTEALMKADGLSSVRQRLDSTHIISNIAILTRLGLFTETVTNFMRELRKMEAGKLATLDEGYAKRYLDREGYFADAKREQAQRRLPVVALDLYALVQAFKADEVVCAWLSYELMVRLLAEQCEVVGEEGAEQPVTLKEPKDVRSDSLQSPHDPDATYGHKGKGYEAQITETCVKDNPYEVVTSLAINGAHVSDQGVAVPMISDLIYRGIAPKAMLADTNYGSGENLAACADMGVELLARVQDPDAPSQQAREEVPVEGATRAADAPDTATTASEATSPVAPSGNADAAIATSQGGEPLGLEAFRFTDAFHKIATCPGGQAPLRHQILNQHPGFKATFDGEVCATCPLLALCPTRRAADGNHTLRWRDVKAATATRQREQQEPAFKEAYKLRSGIESTNAEIKGRHGAGDIRVRGGPRVEAAMFLKAAALNTKRAVQYHTEALRIHQENNKPPIDARE